MSKIICEICGTVYPDTADKCPICGYARSTDASNEEMELQEENPSGRGGHYAHRKGREIFDYDAENGSAAPAPSGDSFDDSEVDREEEAPRGKSSAVLIVILVMAIVGMIGMIGFLFFRFLMPYGMLSSPTTEATTIATEAPTTVTTIPTVPCTSLVMTSGKAELTREGQYWLIHAVALPDDTTDVITYQSMDENVAIVSEEGRITAVGEGETQVLVTCGTVQMSCPVSVSYMEETEPPTEEATEAATEAPTEAPTEAAETKAEDAVEATEAAEAAETVEATEAAVEETGETKPVPADGVKLKLKKTDISFGVRGVSFALELDCDLDPLQVKWSVGNTNVAVVDGEGTVTTVGPGTTRVYAEYEGQKVECIVRCQFN